MTSVGIYARISDDQDGQALGVARQQMDVRKLIAHKGWTVGGTYVDNSLSAYKRQIIRPEFERLLVDLEDGTVDGVAVWDMDRLARQPRDLERLIELYDNRPLVFGTAQADIDLSTSDGRFTARLFVNFANKSSADMSRRLTRKSLELAMAGKDSGGGSRPFGYNQDRKTLDPVESAAIRDGAERLLAGESVGSICRSLTERGILIGKNTKWNPGVFRRLLLRPRLAGLRQYRGAIMLSPDGSPVKAEWEPALDLETWEAVKALLTDPAREVSAGRIDRRYLLSGFLRCKCGTKMYGVTKKGKPSYTCPQFKGCGLTTRIGAPMDEYMTEMVLLYLERQELEATSPLNGPEIEPLEEKIAEAERSIAALITEWDAGRMSDSIFFAAQGRREASLTALKRQRTSDRRKRAHRAPVGVGVRETWANANLSQRRAILSEVILAIQVLPKGQGRLPFVGQKHLKIQWLSGAE